MLYQDDFDGEAVTLLGTTPDVTIDGNVWSNANPTTENDFLADGTVLSGTGDDSAWLPFTPVQGRIYTLRAEMDVTSGGQHLTFGFAKSNISNALAESLAYFRLTNDGTVRASAGLGNVNNVTVTGFTETVKLRVVLDCTDADPKNWISSHYIDVNDVEFIDVAENRKASGSDTTIQYVGFSRRKGTCGTFDNFELKESALIVGLPSQPTGLTASGGTSVVDLSWEASENALYYEVKRAEVSGGPYVTIGSPTTPSYQDTDVVNETTYYYVVSAVNPLGASADSEEVSATPHHYIPPAPTGLTAVTVWSEAQTNLTWNASEGAVSYRVKRSETPGGPYEVLADTSATDYQDTTAMQGVIYYYVVSAMGEFAEGENSAEVWVLTGSRESTIYYDDFDGDAVTLLGTVPDITMEDANSMPITWGNSPVEPGTDPESDILANGTVASTGLLGDNDSAWLPFTPEQGYIYVLSTEMDVTGGSDFMTFGFAVNNISHALAESLGHFRRTRYRQVYASPGLGNTNNILVDNVVGPAKLTVVLDCTDESSANWTTSHYINDVLVAGAWNRKAAAGGNYTDIVYAGLSRYKGAGGIFNYFELKAIEAPLTQCGQWGYLEGDVDGNCYVNMDDISAMASEWLATTDPAEEGAVRGRYDDYTAYNIPRAVTAPTIDGVLSDGEWDDAVVTSIVYPDIVTPPNIGWRTGPEPNEIDFSAYYHYKWDNDYLYIGIKVIDESLIFNQGYPDDHVAWAINLNQEAVNETGITYYRMFIDWYDDLNLVTDERYRLDYIPYNALKAASSDPNAPSSYSIEVAFKWSDFAGYVPQIGDKHGFAALICDNDANDGARDTMMTDCGNGRDGVISRPADYRVVTLTGALACGDFGFIDSDLNGDCEVNLTDLVVLVADWTRCVHPLDDGCIDIR